MGVVVLPAVGVAALLVAALVVVVSAQAHLKVTDMSSCVGDGQRELTFTLDPAAHSMTRLCFILIVQFADRDSFLFKGGFGGGRGGGFGGGRGRGGGGRGGPPGRGGRGGPRGGRGGSRGGRGGAAGARGGAKVIIVSIQKGIWEHLKIFNR